MSLNPWPLIAALTLGLLVGIGGAWYFQSLRLDELQAKYDGFVVQVKAEGEITKALADREKAENQRLKEATDHDYQIELSALRATNSGLRNARTRRGVVPAATPTARHPELACFDRTEFVAALQRLDVGVGRLVNEGDEGTLALAALHDWAKSLEARP
jgi:hypothetical protein